MPQVDIDGLNSTLKADVIRGQAGTSTKLGGDLDLNGNDITGTGSIPAVSAQKNIIINGDFNIWQRGTTATGIANSPTYVADRWAAWGAGVGTDITFSRQAAALVTHVYCAKVQRTSTETDVSGIGISQNLENFSSYPMQGKVVTLSFYAKKGANFSATSDLIRVKMSTGTTGNESTATFSGGPASGFTGNAVALDTTQAITASWVKYSFTTSALASDMAQLGLWIYANPTGTAGADDSFYITGVQLETGSVATDFEVKNHADEFARCQRYYEITGIGASGAWSSSGAATVGGAFAVEKRAIPTMSLNTTTPGMSEPGVANRTGTASTYSVDPTGGTSSWSGSINGFTSATGTNPAILRTNAIVANAEL